MACSHLGPVNTITFVEENRRMVTTSDDQSVRIWEWDVPVDTKSIAGSCCVYVVLCCAVL
jgi:WD40 repeat protein